jgi:hypothetical protein
VPGVFRLPSFSLNEGCADCWTVYLDRARKATGLTFSECKMSDRALLIYSILPADAAEIRAAFHCQMVSAERIYEALKKVLCA